MPATGALIGTPASISDSVEPQTERHRGRAVRRQHLGHEADRVGELVERRHDRQQRALGEQAVADLAALRAAHEAGLAGGERREVVVVHVALARRRVDAVDHLVHALHAERGDVEDLGLAALEQAAAVRGGHDADLGGQRADVADAAAVDAHALFDDALADDLLGERADGRLELLLGVGHVGEAREQRREQLDAHRGLGRLALGLVGDLLGRGELSGTGGLDRGVDLVGVVDLRRERRRARPRRPWPR